MGTISFDPQITTSPSGTFQPSTQGYVQGSFLDDPSARMYLSSGRVDSTVTQPVWGGMTITEGVPAPGDETLGAPLTLATDYTDLTAFTVFNQAANMIITPGNSVQQSDSGMSVSYFRMGSNARIAVKCDPTLAAALDAGNTMQQVQWDFTNQKLIAFTSGTALNARVLSVNTNSRVVNYDSGTGAVTWATGPVAVILI